MENALKAAKPALTELELQALAESLEATGDYRVLRRMKPRMSVAPPDDAVIRFGLFLDVETTGLDVHRDEIIELAMVPFTYGLEGQIFAVLEPFQSFSQPSRPIPPEITALTGITDAMVAGASIDLEAVNALANRSSLVVAHNAAFDRRFIERLSTTFAGLPWACSMSQVDWAGEGYEGTKLAYLVGAAGYFYDRHRATNDCLAAIELLAAPLPISGQPAMARLLEQARKPGWRIWAERAPFELKDTLKARGYRWNGENRVGPKAWYVEVGEHDLEAELAYLKVEIYQREIDLLVQRLTAYNRFTDRHN